MRSYLDPPRNPKITRVDKGHPPHEISPHYGIMSHYYPLCNKSSKIRPYFPPTTGRKSFQNFWTIFFPGQGGKDSSIAAWTQRGGGSKCQSPKRARRGGGISWRLPVGVDGGYSLCGEMESEKRRKINMEAQIHPIEKENHLNRTIHFQVRFVNLRGCSCK